MNALIVLILRLACAKTKLVIAERGPFSPRLWAAHDALTAAAESYDSPTHAR